MRMCFHKSGLLAFAVVVLVLVFSQARQVEAAWTTNVILMISDGQGFNTVEATRYFTGSAAVYEDFPVQYGMTTYSANNPAGYDPVQMWADFEYAKSGATDSAAAATALYTGVKTLNGRIGIDTSGNPLTSIAEIAGGLGKATGAISSVLLSHATPAAVYAHNISRNNYADIANEMIYDSGLDVIMGAGHPYYDTNGIYQYPTIVEDKYVGGIDTWNNLVAGPGTANDFILVEEVSDFASLADGTYAGGLPEKVFGVAQVATTLQYQRTAGAPMITNVPTLSTMTRGALNVLSQDPDGMFLMVEGGAVDWAGHESDLTRQIEEQEDFNASVEAVVDWVETNSSWEETLLIVTADHETGYLWGPGSDPDHIPLTDVLGAGILPDHSWNSTSHTNQLVPLYAKGAGSELFAGLVDGTDAQAGIFWGFNGQYIDNTDVFVAMNAAMVPEPSTNIMLAAGALTALFFRRRRRVKARHGSVCQREE
jgi:alkaline phosphatase